MHDFWTKMQVVDRDDPVIGLMPPDKLTAVAAYADLNATSRVIDFGCGYGEALLCWAETFGISGLGIDRDEQHIARAKEILATTAYADRVEYVCADAMRYPFQPGFYHLAACASASNMFGPPESMFRNAIRHLRQTILLDGYLLIVEPYYNATSVPQELVGYEGKLPTEVELTRVVRDEGFEIVCFLHSDVTDWDRYISSNLAHAVRWLRENHGHADWRKRLESHHRFQDMYVQHRKRYQEVVALLMTRI